MLTTQSQIHKKTWPAARCKECLLRWCLEFLCIRIIISRRKGIGLFVSSYLFLYPSWSKFLPWTLMSLYFWVVLPGHLGICRGNPGHTSHSVIWLSSKFAVFFPLTGVLQVCLSPDLTVGKIKRMVLSEKWQWQLPVFYWLSIQGLGVR